MSKHTISITLDTPEVHPGDQVTGTIHFDEDKRAQGATAALQEVDRVNVSWQANTPTGQLFHVSTGDMGQSDAGTKTDTVASVDLPSAHGEQRFAFTVPADAAPTVYDAVLPEQMRELVSWQVHVTVNRGWVGQAEVAETFRVLSPSSEYAFLTDQPPAAKSEECPIGVWLDQRVLRPGEPVSGTVVVTPRTNVQVKRISLRLERQRVEGDDGYRRPWRSSVGTELSGKTYLQPGQTLTFPFSIPLPDDVPPSYTGKHSELHWFATANVEVGMFHGDYVGEAEFVVYTGREGGTPAAPPAAPALAAGSPASGDLDELVSFVTSGASDASGDRELEDRRIEAVRTIAGSHDPRAVEALIGLLDVDTGYLPPLSETKRTVLCAVIEELGKRRDPRAVDPLLDHLHADAVIHRRASGAGDMTEMVVESMAADRFKAAAGALAEIGDPRAIPGLTAEAENKRNVFIRRSAKKAAAKIQRSPRSQLT